jgi:hypothetical protein
MVGDRCQGTPENSKTRLLMGIDSVGDREITLAELAEDGFASTALVGAAEMVILKACSDRRFAAGPSFSP